MSKKDEVMKALEKVFDPELGISVVDMGFIYEIRIEGGHVEIDMTLTNPACPLAASIIGMVEEAAKKVSGVESVKVNLVFEPPWTPERIKGWQGKKI